MELPTTSGKAYVDTTGASRETKRITSRITIEAGKNKKNLDVSGWIVDVLPFLETEAAASFVANK